MDKRVVLASTIQKTLSQFNQQLGTTSNLVGAQSDIEAIMSWLEEFEDSPHTHRTYQKESLRFLMWSYQSLNLTLIELKKQDIHKYREFLTNPQPRSLWCQPLEIQIGNKKQWQPFKGPLSENSIKISMTILSGLFSYLHHAQYLPANPFKLIKKKSVLFQANIQEQQIELQERILSLDEFVLILGTLEQMEKEEIESSKWCSRARFILLFLAFTGLRVSELENAKWKDLQQIQGHWWLKVLGKGSKLARVPINTECLEIIENYQRDISHTPNIEETLICQLNRKGVFVTDKKLSSRSMNFIFKKIINHIDLKTNDNLLIQKLQKFSPHWLRHFSASQQALANIPLHFIKAHHRHSKEDTTRLYVHHESSQAHKESEKLNLLTQIKDKSK